jgi:hypothetical protein
MTRLARAGLVLDCPPANAIPEADAISVETGALKLDFE